MSSLTSSPRTSHLHETDDRSESDTEMTTETVTEMTTDNVDNLHDLTYEEVQAFGKMNDYLLQALPKSGVNICVVNDKGKFALQVKTKFPGMKPAPYSEIGQIDNMVYTPLARNKQTQKQKKAFELLMQMKDALSHVGYGEDFFSKLIAGEVGYRPGRWILTESVENDVIKYVTRKTDPAIRSLIIRTIGDKDQACRKNTNRWKIFCVKLIELMFVKAKDLQENLDATAQHVAVVEEQKDHLQMIVASNANVLEEMATTINEDLLNKQVLESENQALRTKLEIQQRKIDYLETRIIVLTQHNDTDSEVDKAMIEELRAKLLQYENQLEQHIDRQENVAKHVCNAITKASAEDTTIMQLPLQIAASLIRCAPMRYTTNAWNSLISNMGNGDQNAVLAIRRRTRDPLGSDKMYGDLQSVIEAFKTLELKLKNATIPTTSMVDNISSESKRRRPNRHAQSCES